MFTPRVTAEHRRRS